jgi:two-component system, chemotaxis family, sensor kinase CheA
VDYRQDAEFRRIFADEASQQLANIAGGALDLADGRRDPELLAGLFRSAHSLKGAAAVVHLDEVTRVTHAMEDLLADCRAGRREPSPALADALLGAVEALREMVPALLAGEDRAAQADAVERRLKALAGEGAPAPAAEPPAPSPEAPAPQPAPAPVPVPAPEPAPAPAPEPPPAEPEPLPPAAAAPRTGDIVRVPVERLDELVNLIGEASAAQLRLGRRLADRLGADPETIPEFRRLSRLLSTLQEQGLRTRMVSVGTVATPLEQAARSVALGAGKQVRWEMAGEQTELDRHVLEELREGLIQLVRNAVDHGLETPEERLRAGKPEAGTVRLSAWQSGSDVVMALADDGRGIDEDAVRAKAGAAGAGEDLASLIFRSGFSTARAVTGVSGRGVGLDVVRDAIARVRGRIDVTSQPGKGTEFRITVPMTLAVLPCLVVSAGGRRYALPVHSTLAVAQVGEGDELAVEGGRAVRIAGALHPLASLAAVLGHGGEEAGGPLVVLSGEGRSHALRVDALIERRDVVVGELSRVLPRIEVVSGASVEADGGVLLVLDPSAVVARARRLGGPRSVVPAPAAPAPAPAAPVADGAPAAAAAEPATRVLVVDDTMTVRELQRSILERAGFGVSTAADGQEALARLAERPVDLVLTDIEMPRMDGLELTAAIRRHPRLRSLPVIVITSRGTDEDRRRGLEAGADAYIVKHAFDEGQLLAAVERVMGAAA